MFNTTQVETLVGRLVGTKRQLSEAIGSVVGRAFVPPHRALSPGQRRQLNDTIRPCSDCGTWERADNLPDGICSSCVRARQEEHAEAV